MNYFIAFLYIVAAVKATDYCANYICNRGIRHVACGNRGNYAFRCPSDAKVVNRTDKFKRSLLHFHNDKRNLIAGGAQPELKPACRMATLQWDDELAKIAEYNVRECKMAHDKCRNTDNFKYAGQNLASIGYVLKRDAYYDMMAAVELWFSEVKDIRQEYIDTYPLEYFGPAIGHFTVMVNERNTHMGCAAIDYTIRGQHYRVFLIACNYATTNMIDFPVYKSCSKAGTNCTMGMNPAYPNLCNTTEPIEVNKWFN